MRLKSRTWFVISMLLFATAVWMWHYANDRAEQARQARDQARARATLLGLKTQTPLFGHATNSVHRTSYRVNNTKQTAGQLARNERGIILRNALIDTGKPLKLDIPEHLRSKGAPGSYIVQANGKVGPQLYTALKLAGAQYVSYIPNNAVLVKASPEAAQVLEKSAMVEAVLPYEPYYKLDNSLLPAAVEQQAQTNELRVTTFPGQRDAALSSLTGLGAKLIGEDTTPFGPELIVQVPPESLVAVAQLPVVQDIEKYSRRQKLNDLTRVRLGVAADTLTNTPNYLGLTGTNVWVNLNDTGVDTNHPDFGGPSNLRVMGDPNGFIDYDGHGTHVAGIIAGSGAESGTVNGANVPGSVKGADFRGKAPQATLYLQLLDLLSGPFISDLYLQTNASAKMGTNGYISNNSWGYQDLSYDMESASYDAAVRDAQPDTPGEQPLLYVFAAGNNNQGADSINSPGTAKNVITVGASDSPRNITNIVEEQGTTNAIFFDDTDNSNSVASFSSAGNVGVGIEGEFGRFKPDVVAPGVFIASTRATNFMDPTNQVEVFEDSFPGEVVDPNQTNVVAVDLPTNVIAVILQVAANGQSPNPFPSMPILFDMTNPPTTLQGINFAVVSNALSGGIWYAGVVSPSGERQPVSYDLNVFVVVTNNLGNYFTVLSNLNNVLRPWYRYENGTSMAAPAVAGVLALMDEQLEQRMGLPRPSPALMKALLINGARSMNDFYDFNVQPTAANVQGWGLVNIGNSLPIAMTNNGAGGPVQGPTWISEQNPTNALSTGQSHSYQVQLNDTFSPFLPLRVTLVWTDPPGDPVAGIALVNDLDLTVTDNVTGEVYVGNNFQQQDIYTEESDPTNLWPSDVINNVENVYIDGSVDSPLDTTYTVTVTAKRVNVNAATLQTNNIMQDYALVISSDEQSASPFIIADQGPATNGAPLVTVATSGDVLLHQRVGAYEPNIYNYATGATNGDILQWHFFVFTNTLAATNAAFTNVAFITFLPPNLSLPARNTDADIDLYVSTDAGLLNLNPVVMASTNTLKDTGRGGTATVVYTNSTANQVYYIGVKAEDQESADFGFYAVAQTNGFGGQNNSDGTISFTGTPVPQPIPDGAYDSADVLVSPPALIFVPMVSTSGGKPTTIRKIAAALNISHQNPGDLIGTLTFNGKQAVLNNHSGSYPGIFTNYDDLPEDPTIPSSPSDGPPNLKTFVGDQAIGAFILNERDYAQGQTGAVQSLTLTISPQPPTNNNFTVIIPPGGWFYDYVDVPDDATNLNIALGFPSGGPLSIYITNTDNVTIGDYGATGIAPPGGSLNLDQTNTPPLAGGIWYYGIYNAGTTPVTVHVVITIEENLTPDLTQTLYNTNAIPLQTDAATTSQILITNDQQLVSLQVGVRINDPNLDDLALRLISPQGTSVLLFEDRGGLAATNLGLSLGTNGNNYVYTVFTENTNLATNLIKFAPPPYASSNYFAAVTNFTSTFETTNAGVYTNGQTVDGWFIATNALTTNFITNGAIITTNYITNTDLQEVSVVTDTNIAHGGTNFLALTSARILRTVTTVPGVTYQLQFASRGPGITDWWPFDGNGDDIIGTNNGTVLNAVYDDGEVNKAVKFNGNNSVVNFNATVGNFGTNDFTVDFWIETPKDGTQTSIMEKRAACDGNGNFWEIRMGPAPGNVPDGSLDPQGTLGSVPASFGMPSTHPANDGIFHHYTYFRHDSVLYSYFDGAFDVNEAIPPSDFSNNTVFRVGQSVCQPGNDGTVPFPGTIDELDFFNRALSPAEIYAIYHAGNAGKATTNSILPNVTVTVDGVVTNVIADNSTNWETNIISFTATTNQTTIEIAGNPLSRLFDDIQFVQAAYTNYNNYYLPEESLSPFTGENALGEWTLQVVDTRNDSIVATNGVLLGWNLQMTYSSTNVNLIVLTNRVPETNSVGGSILYYGFDVPAQAHFATNILLNATGPLNLLFDQTALPTGNLPGDYTLISVPSGDGTNTLSTIGTPPALLPAQRYFLGVQNPNPLTTVSFTIEVACDVTTNTITPLTNGVAVITNILATNVAQYYYFDVPTNAGLASFQILNVTNEVDLYLNNAYPPPSPLDFDYESVNAGTNGQDIVVGTNSTPIPLTAGRWYLSAYNYNATNAITYTILASVEFTNVGPAIIPLGDSVAYGDTAPAGAPPTQTFYSFTIMNSIAAVQFTVNNTSLSGNVDLIVREGSLPTPEQSYQGSYNLGIAPERIVIVTNAALPSLNGTWYLGVPNNSPFPVSFDIEATTAVNSPTNFPSVALFSNANIASENGGFTMNWNAVPGATYEIDLSTNLQTWQVMTNITATSSTASYTDPAPINTQPRRYYRLYQNQ